MKKGDFIYYYSKESGMIPAKILKVNKKTFTIEGDFPDGERIANVKQNNCILQFDWLKENELN